MGTLLQMTTNQGVTFPGGFLSDDYKKIKLPATRIVGSDMVDIAMRTHYVKGLLDSQGNLTWLRKGSRRRRNMPQ